MGDTPNEKMSRVRTHPLSGNGQRPPYPLGREPRSAHSLCHEAAFCLRLALAVGAFCFVLTHYGLFAPSAIQRTVLLRARRCAPAEGDITNIEFEKRYFQRWRAVRVRSRLRRQ